MGGFVEHADGERQVNQESAGGGHGQAQSELLLSLPGALLHQVMDGEDRVFPLAEGTLNVVSVVMPDHGNKIGLVAKVGEFEYPLAKDTACLRSAPFQYVFVLTDGVLVGLTLAPDTPSEGVELLELLLENCCDFAVQQAGSAKPDAVSVTKLGEQQEVRVDSKRQAQASEQQGGGLYPGQQGGPMYPTVNQPGSSLPQGAGQGRNKYVISGPDAPSPSQTPYDSTLPGSQPTGGNKYIVSGHGAPAAPAGFGGPGTSACGAAGGPYGGGGAYGAQVPVVHPDGTVAGATQRPKKMGERLAEIVGAGAGMLGQGIVKGGEWTANKIQEHGQKQKAKMVPNERPMEISRPIQSGAKGVNQASKMVDTTAKKVVGGVVYVITAVASSVGGAVRAVGGNQEPGKEPVVGARALAVASVDGIARVFDALETSGKRVMASSREVSSDLTQHKYGARAGQLTYDGMSTLGHMIHAG